MPSSSLLRVSGNEIESRLFPTFDPAGKHTHLFIAFFKIFCSPPGSTGFLRSCTIENNLLLYRQRVEHAGKLLKRQSAFQAQVPKLLLVIVAQTSTAFQDATRFFA
jgi:hypothetical protein